MAELENLNFFKKLQNVSESFFKLVGDYAELISLEARLASRSLCSIATLLFLLVPLLATTWIFISAFLTLMFFDLQFSLLSSLAIVIGINFLLLLATVLMISKLKGHLFFKASRRQLNFSADKDHTDETIITENPTA